MEKENKILDKYSVIGLTLLVLIIISMNLLLVLVS